MEEQKLLKRKKKVLNENNPSNTISAILNLAQFYFKEDRYEEAIDEFKQAARQNKALNNLIDYGICHRMIGEAYLNIRKFEKALEHQQIHLQIAKQEKNKLEEQRALATIGHTYLTTYLEGTNHDNKTPLHFAYKIFMKSLAVCESLTDISKREHMDMMSRLFANLGIVQESLTNFDKALELVMKSVTISKNYDLHEQLQRNHCLLGSIYTKMGSFSNAIHEYNLSMEIAGRLPDKIKLISSALLSKSELLIKLGDYHGAKTALLKAYKLKNPSECTMDLIERNLKTIVAMCYTEEKLSKAADTDHETRKKLYEKMGDGSSALNCYSKAIEYYEKMLDSAIKNGESGKNLSPAYVSLAQTYLDNKQYDLAIEYFEKDFNVNQLDTKEAIHTLFSIIETMKEAGKDYQEIEMIFQQAKDLTTRANNLHLQGKVLSRQKIFIEKNYDYLTTEKLQKQLDELNYQTSDDESCDSPQTPAIGDEIDLNNITDISDDDDDTKQREKESRSIRKRTKAFTIKRNNKGETQLHTACIQGNLILVERLLDQGHAVNVRDNCGWLPIHEACIHGHSEIVERLIQKGAAINDRGGTLCNGITPLHDAASNGHLQVIQLLLDKGANVVSKTDEGETPFHFLKRWKRDNEIISREGNDLFERIFKRMEQVLEKCGQINTIETEKNDDDEFKSFGSNRLGTLRRSHSTVIESSEDTESSNQSENDLNNVKFEYKEVMNNLRNRTRETTFHSINNKSKRSALLTSDDVDDDWLEDDLGNCSIKKRKINSICSTTNIRRSYDKENRSSDGEISSTSLDIPSISRHSSTLPKTNQVTKRKRQVSLISSGFTRKRSDSSISSVSSPKKSQTLRKRNSFTENISISDKDEINFQHDASIKRNSPKSSQNQSEQTVFVDIRILEKLYRVPVVYSEINCLTIQWLAEEASKRYSRKECMKPSLELQTKSGAILAEDDPINILFPLGSTQCEEIIGNVIKWNIQPILERYKEACVSLGLNENSDVSKILRETSTILNLSNQNLESDSITPLCKALNRHVSLVNLDLSGNYGLKQEEINLLSSAFSSFKNLTVLNLSNTNLNESHLGVLAQTFLQTDSSILENLISLDLSYNPIGDEGLPHLAVITRNVKLKSLFLKDVDFTSKIFDNITNTSIELYLDFLQCFDLSFNNLDKNDVIKFLSWIQPSEIETLDISNNLITESGLLMEIVCSFQTADVVKIKNLNLSRCRTTDSEIYELINLLEKTPTLLNTLNLSYNEEITSISLRRFLQGNLKLESLILIGCNNFKYFEDSWEILNETLISITLNVDVNDETELCEKLVNMWRKSRVDYKINRDLPTLLKLSTER